MHFNKSYDLLIMHCQPKKVKNSLEELGLHCDDMHVLGVFEADKYRDK